MRTDYLAKNEPRVGDNHIHTPRSSTTQTHLSTFSFPINAINVPCPALLPTATSVYGLSGSFFPALMESNTHWTLTYFIVLAFRKSISFCSFPAARPPPAPDPTLPALVRITCVVLLRRRCALTCAPWCTRRCFNVWSLIRGAVVPEM